MFAGVWALLTAIHDICLVCSMRMGDGQMEKCFVIPVFVSVFVACLSIAGLIYGVTMFTAITGKGFKKPIKPSNEFCSCHCKYYYRLTDSFISIIVTGKCRTYV